MADLGQTEQWASEPSDLPGWTRGHVVAHLLGNAEGMLNLTRWASTGERTLMYPYPEARMEAINERATWPLARLRDELGVRITEIAGAVDSLHEPLAAHDLLLGSGSAIEAWEIPAMRLREVEIHHVDLASGYSAADWSGRFVLRTLNQVVPFFAAHRTMPAAQFRATDTGRVWDFGQLGPDLLGRESDLLAWLIGRRHGHVLLSDGGTPDPAPAWV